MSRLSTILAFLIFSTGAASAQCMVASQNGNYQVYISIVPKSIAVSAADCPWGYNYNVVFDYQVTFTGTNIPNALHALQATISCGSQSNSYFSLPLSGGSGTATTTSNPFISVNGAAYNYGAKPGCQQATVQTLNCGVIAIYINGPGISAQTISCNVAAPLPVELVDYSGMTSNSGVELAWSTASELRNDHFTIYRSTDGETWEETAQIQGAGTTTSYNAYSWTDEQPAYGVNYYKLTQTDLDGAVKEQGIVGVENVDASASLTAVYPNPSADGTFNVRVLSKEDRPVEVVLRDPLGRIAGTAELTHGQAFGSQYVLNDIVRTEGGRGLYLLDIFQDGALIGHHKVEVVR